MQMPEIVTLHGDYQYQIAHLCITLVSIPQRTPWNLIIFLVSNILC